jgi:hypothetical protein
MKAWLGHLLFLDQRRIALTQSWVYNHVTHSTLHSHHSGKLPGRMPTQPVLGRRHHTLWLSDWKSLPLASGCWSATSAATVSQHHNIGRPHWSVSVLCRLQIATRGFWSTHSHQGTIGSESTSIDQAKLENTYTPKVQLCFTWFQLEYKPVQLRLETKRLSISYATY